jgi:SAM-dependent methyltransferase
VTLEEASFSAVFAEALRGAPCSVVGLDEGPRPIPVDAWSGAPDAADSELVSHCSGPTIDLGCGPGRLTELLARRGHVVLGVDIVAEAVAQTRSRGASALVRDVFDRLPGEGRWETALLADGNVGIGGEPLAMLRRARELVAPGGRIVVEVAGPGQGVSSSWASLACGDRRSRPFRWAVVGVDAVGALALDAGVPVRTLHRHADRWWAVLGRPS